MWFVAIKYPQVLKLINEKILLLYRGRNLTDKEMPCKDTMKFLGIEETYDFFFKYIYRNFFFHLFYFQVMMIPSYFKLSKNCQNYFTQENFWCNKTSSYAGALEATTWASNSNSKFTCTFFHYVAGFPRIRIFLVLHIEQKAAINSQTIVIHGVEPRLHHAKSESYHPPGTGSLANASQPQTRYLWVESRSIKRSAEGMRVLKERRQKRVFLGKREKDKKITRVDHGICLSSQVISGSRQVGVGEGPVTSPTLRFRGPLQPCCSLSANHSSWLIRWWACQNRGTSPITVCGLLNSHLNSYGITISYLYIWIWE